MPTRAAEKDIDNPYYLLGFNQEDLDDFSEDEGLLEELGSLDQNKDYYPEETDNAIQNPKSFEQQNEIQTNGTISSPLYATTTIQKEKQTLYNVPETRSAVEGLLLFSDVLTSFTCDIICEQSISYTLLANESYNPIELEKLDVVLNENSILNIQISCTLNGLDVLEYPPWMTDALNEVMNKVKFTNITLPPPSGQEQQQANSSRQFQFIVQKAFITTPLSYLLEKQAPHGVLEKFNLHLDWCTNKGSKEFQLVWKRGFQREAITRYTEDALFEVLIRRVFHHYPLVFSNFHVKRLAPIISYLPHISQSLDKIIRTARNTSPQSEFLQGISDKVKMIEKNTSIIRPYYTETQDDNPDSTTTDFTLGMYHTISKNAKQQQKKSAILNKSTALNMESPPDALEAIGKIWSITCSSAAPTLAEQL